MASDHRRSRHPVNEGDEVASDDLPPHVLIVDDEREIREMLALTFELEGFDVTTAADGHAALAAIEQDPPDVVILDIMMPRLDGLTVLHRIKENDDTKRIPVMLLSAKAAPHDVEMGMRMGADDYASKPIDPLLLVERARALIVFTT